MDELEQLCINPAALGQSHRLLQKFRRDYANDEGWTAPGNDRNKKKELMEDMFSKQLQSLKMQIVHRESHEEYDFTKMQMEPFDKIVGGKWGGTTLRISRRR